MADVDNVPVTSGYGTTVATDNKGGAHHQRVVTHGARAFCRVQPPALALSYEAGRCVGGEMTFENATRLAGDTAVVNAVTVAVRGTIPLSPGSLLLLLYPTPLLSAPADNAQLTLTVDEAATLQTSILVPSSAFVQAGGWWIASLSGLELVVQAGAGQRSLCAVAAAVNGFTVVSDDGLVVTLAVSQD